KLNVFFTAESGLSNPWGHSFDRWGQNFLNGAAGGGIFYLTPGTPRLVRPPRDPLPRLMAPLTCGSEFISGSHMPEELHGLMALNDPKMKVVHRYRFSDDGSGYAAEELEPLLASPETERRDHLQITSPPFRPVDIKMGPDGALYVLDFYSLIIGHMTYNFRDPNRDKAHGRVWRITAKERPLMERVRFSELSRGEVLDYLKSPFGYHRDQARRVLYDDPDPEATVEALRRWVQELDSTDPELEHHLLEALWTFQTIDVVEPDLLRRLLRADDPRVRAAATRVLRYWLDDIEDPLSLLKIQVTDDHPRVRLEAVAALSYIPLLEAAEAAVQVLDFPMDRFLTYALRLTMVALEEHWHPALEAGRAVFGGKKGHLDFALKAIGPYGDELQSVDWSSSSPLSVSTQR
ncbi:MAG TPA: HEAT repeat domain-containing protein, partial [Acidobacteriota bacterium]|nr:HEAT repeat domain-containing protein [Acidobacteriota bacterium]